MRTFVSSRQPAPSPRPNPALLNSRFSVPAIWPGWALLLLICPGSPILADAHSAVLISGESKEAAQRLAAADELAAAGKWLDAMLEYNRLSTGGGDSLLPTASHHWLQLRFVCQARLSLLPSSILSAYRERVDPQADRWWRQAQLDKDVSLLRRIANECRCSHFGDRAIDMLGDLAAERGDWEEAEIWWQRIIAPPKSLLHADPPPEEANSRAPGAAGRDIDRVRVHAKVLFGYLMSARRSDFDRELPIFKTLHANAEGQFLGRHGKYVDLLSSLRGRALAELATPVRNPSCLTFAGSPSRNCLLPEAPNDDLYRTSWEISLNPLGEAESANDFTSPPGPGIRQSPSAFFAPLIAGNHLFLGTQSRIVSYDVVTGKLNGRYDLFDDLKGIHPALDSVRAQTSPPRTLAIEGNRLFACLSGSIPAEASTEAAGPTSESYLVCLKAPRSPGTSFECSWVAKLRSSPDANASFSGAPLTYQGRVYVASASSAGLHRITAIECYNAETGLRIWNQPVCESTELSSAQPPAVELLLTAAGPNIVLCTHSGAIVAVDALTGRHAWATTYERSTEDIAVPSTGSRMPIPCLFAAGQVFAAPDDAKRVLCLDALTGQLRWQSLALDVVDLLGVVDGKLILTTGSFPKGIRALNTHDGQTIRSWLQPDDGTTQLPSYGRGFLAGGKVFWPTAYGMRVLNQEDGQPDTPLGYYLANRLGNHLGNLTFGAGTLAISDANTLRVFPALASPRSFSALQTPLGQP